MILLREVSSARENNTTTHTFNMVLTNSRYQVDGVKVRSV